MISMALLPTTLALTNEALWIPIWFYSYSAAIYGLSALIGLFISIFSYRFFKLNKSRSGIALSIGFLLLTVAFASLAFTSLYTYKYNDYFKKNLDLGPLGLVNSIGFNIYYVTSIAAYLALLLMYLWKDVKEIYELLFKKNILVLYVPLWYLNLSNFHIVSSIALVPVVVKNLLNFYRNKDFNNFLVLLSFVCMLGFHLLLLFTSFDPTLYLAANTMLALGFSSLLLMLVRVITGGREKV